MAQDMEARNAKITAMLKAGEPVAKIAKAVGLSTVRVYRFAKDNGVKRPKTARVAAPAKKRTQPDRPQKRARKGALKKVVEQVQA